MATQVRRLISARAQGCPDHSSPSAPGRRTIARITRAVVTGRSRARNKGNTGGHGRGHGSKLMLAATKAWCMIAWRRLAFRQSMRRLLCRVVDARHSGFRTLFSPRMSAFHAATGNDSVPDPVPRSPMRQHRFCPLDASSANVHDAGHNMVAVHLPLPPRRGRQQHAEPARSADPKGEVRSVCRRGTCRRGGRGRAHRGRCRLCRPLPGTAQPVPHPDQGQPLVRRPVDGLPEQLQPASARAGAGRTTAS